MSIAIVLGTRPEIIKMSPVIRECEQMNLDYFILHTGQHYSYEMDLVFFEQLELPEARYNLDVGSGHHGEQTGPKLLANHVTITKFWDFNNYIIRKLIRRRLMLIYADLRLHQRPGNNWKIGQCQMTGNIIKN